MTGLTMRLQHGADGVARHVPALAPPPTAPKGRKKRVVPDPMKTNGEASAEQLRLLLERIERIEEEERGVADDKKDVFSEAKAMGFDVKTMRTILKLRRMESHHREEAEAVLETYLISLGMK